MVQDARKLYQAFYPHILKHLEYDIEILISLTGKGKIVGVEQVLNWYDLEPIPINAVSFGTGYGAYGVWRLGLLPAAFIEIPESGDGGGGLSGGAIAGKLKIVLCALR